MPAPDVVYRRTEQGSLELQVATRGLSRVERLVLILADGKLTLREVCARLPAVDSARIERAVRRLAAAGVLEALPGSAVPGGSSGPDAFARSESEIQIPEDKLKKAGTRFLDLKADQEPSSTAAAGLAGWWRSLDMQLLLRRLVGAGAALVALGVVVLGALWVLPSLHSGLSPAGVQARLSRELGASVKVGGATLRFSPLPGLAYTDLELPGGVRIPVAILALGSQRAVSGARRSGNGPPWGEIVVPQLELTTDQAFALLGAAERLERALPDEFPAVRVDSLRFIAAPLLPGHYQGTLGRASDTETRVVLRERRERGDWMVELRPATEDAALRVGFDLHASSWRLPIGPALAWHAASANGWFSRQALVCESFTVEGYGGSATGAAAFASDVQWVGSAAIKASQIDLVLLIGHLAPGGEGAAPAPPVSPIRGIATFDLRAAGRGATLTEAMEDMRAEGSFGAVRASLAGVNLGLAAVQGTAVGMGPRGGGLTRFSELDGTIDAGPAGMRISDLRGRSGAMTVGGQLRIKPDLTLDGGLRVELGGTTTVHAPLNLGVRGSVFAPEVVN